MDPALVALLTDTVLIAAYQGQDAYGNPNYGSQMAVPARIERHFQTMVTAVGPQLVEETKVYLNGDIVLDERARITMPDGATPPIEGLKPVKDEFGQLDHYEVFL